jgi:hypothetical protein
MVKRYQVSLYMWDGKQGAHVCVHQRSFRTHASADTHAGVLNGRHCHHTRYERHLNCVEVVDLRTGARYELTQHFDVPTVGDLGYW